MKKRRNHDAGFKARVALEAVKGERTVSAGFDVGAATNVIVYVYDEDSAWNPATDGTGYGFNVAHDLGGGVTLTAGAAERSGNGANNTTVQAGAYFRF